MSRPYPPQSELSSVCDISHCVPIEVIHSDVRKFRFVHDPVQGTIALCYCIKYDLYISDHNHFLAWLFIPGEESTGWKTCVAWLKQIYFSAP